MPIVVMGPDESLRVVIGDAHDGRDVTVFSIGKDSAIAQDFEDFIDQFPESAFAPYSRNRVAVLQQRASAAPSASVTARLDASSRYEGSRARSSQSWRS